MAFIKGIDALIGSLCNFKTSLTIYETDGLLFYNEKPSWEDFSNSIKKFMS